MGVEKVNSVHGFYDPEDYDYDSDDGFVPDDFYYVSDEDYYVFEDGNNYGSDDNNNYGSDDNNNHASDGD